MHGKPRKSFGQFVREQREKRQISLRKFAARVGMSPTYLSKVERDEFDPPAEAKILAIAEELDQNPDKMLALADKFPEDLPKIFKKRPEEVADFLRMADGLSSEAFKTLTEQAKRLKKSS